MKLAVFVERDGILNHVRQERGHPVSPLTLREMQVRRSALPWIRELKRSDLLVIATTNQPGISQGLQSRRELELIHDSLWRFFDLDDIMVCPHEEGDDCPCRKPRPGLLLEAAYKWGIDLDASYVVSNRWVDAEAARMAGCTSLMIESPWSGDGHRDFLVGDLPAAVNKILALREMQTFVGA